MFNSFELYQQELSRLSLKRSQHNDSAKPKRVEPQKLSNKPMTVLTDGDILGKIQDFTFVFLSQLNILTTTKRVITLPNYNVRVTKLLDFCRVFAILKESQEAILNGTVITKQTLFEKNKDLFGTMLNMNRILKNLCSKTLCCKESQMHISSKK